MKHLLIAALAAFTLAAQPAAKPEPSPASVTAAPSPTERALSETEVLKLTNANLKIKLLGEKFKLDEYRKEAEAITSEQNAVAVTMCLSVGVPKEFVQTQCGVNLGVDPDGKPLLGPDQKPVQPRVWWQRPAAPPVEEKKK